MKCPKCQFENREDAKYCIECGENFKTTCPKCNKTLPLAAKFCDECGHSLKETQEPPDYSEPQAYTPRFLADKILTSRSSIEGERKLVTVFFADVADYTTLSEKLDPEEVHHIMDGCFKILMDEIHQYEGTINQFTGDGVMALFGAPISHEDHAQRACHAALAVQKAISDYGDKIKKDYGLNFVMRIGLNSGHVIVGSIGDDLRMDYTAVGDTTNLASRMESFAKPGTVLISENTHKLVRGFFEFRPFGKIDVKGKEKPQEAYELIKPGEIETRIDASAAKGLTRFVGRENSLSALMEPLEKARSGSGQVVGIVGEAGVGKSRLLLEMRKRLPKDEYTWLEGRCIHYGGSMAYLPILDILKSYFDIQEEDREFIVKKKMEKKILKLDERIKRALSSFQELLSVKVDDEYYLQLDPVVKKLRKFEAIRDLLIRESEKKPLIIAIEDLHWMDKTSGECIQYLIDSLPGTRIMLILLYRPEYTHPWGSKTYYTKIGLDQLGTASSTELIRAILENGEAAPELKNLVLSKAGGNPLFVEEITHSLLENGLIRREDQEYFLTKKASEIEVPDSIQGIIAARLDRVEETLKRIMQIASVIGREFTFRILKSITDMKEDLKSSLLNLQGLEFIYEKQLFPELEYIFKHALTQEVAYNSLLVKRRKDIHEKIGHVIEELYADRLSEYYEVLSYHYERSDNKEKALQYLGLANQKAANATAMEDAKSYFYKAMEMLDTLPDTPENQEKRISLLVNQFIVFEQLFQIPAYYDLLISYEPLAAEIQNTGLKGGFYSRRGVCEMEMGSLDNSIDSLTIAAEISEAAGNMEYTAFSLMVLQWSYLLKGDYDRVFALKEEILRIMAEQFNLLTYVRSFAATSWAYVCCGRWEEAIKDGQDELRAAQKYSDNSQISMAAYSIASALCYKGDLKQAMEYGEMAVKSAPNPAYEAWAKCVLAHTWFRAGEFDKGVGTLDFYVQIFRAGHLILSEIGYAATLSEGYLLAGNYDKAEQTAMDALELVERCGAKIFSGWNHLVLAEVANEKNLSQAASHLEKCVTIFTEIKAENFLAKTYAAYGRFYKKQGDFARAREYFTKAFNIFDRLGTLIEPYKVKEELASLPDE